MKTSDRFNYGVIKEIMSEDQKINMSSFMVFDNIFLNTKGDVMIVIYRAPFEERTTIKIEDYNNKLRSKYRSTILNELGVK